MKWTSTILLAALLISHGLRGQHSDTLVRKKPLRIAAISSAVTYGAGLAGLNHLWYRHSAKQSFRFFNDNPEWSQVDKLGHFYSAFHLSHGFSRGIQHYGVQPSKADLAGAILGFAVLVPIEVFDGFSDAYGASVGDLVADAAGSAFYLAQKRLWNEVRVHPKFSFHYSPYAALRPDVLGEGMERIIKDYNGQTYWLSVDMDKFVRFPAWINLAVGYGASGMIFARDHQHTENGFREPYRRYFISIDIDATAIRTRSKALRTALFLVNMIRIPAPALEWSKDGLTFHGLYH